MAEPSKAACIGAVLGIVAAAAIWAFVLLAGLTFGQRCMIEALPTESVQACVQRLRATTENKER